jgi:predicted nucleic acid-binding protein
LSSFDLRRSLRRIKPHRFRIPLARRPLAALPFVNAAPLVGRDLLLDTCVYIDLLRAKTSATVDRLLLRRPPRHLSVCVAELLHACGRLDPAHPETSRSLARIIAMVEAIPPHRLATATAGVVAEAGILAGLLFRLGGLPPGQEIAALNDAIVYLHALSEGQIVLTRNLRDFDLLNQILPEGRVLFYAASA